MALRLGGLFIQAQVENGAGTFDIGSNDSFANSLESVSVTMRAGGASEIEVSLAPTFTDAVKIIESGFLGYGFPIENQKNQSVSSLLTGGVIQRVPGASPTNSKAAGLSVRFGYSDTGDNNGAAVTPWLSGNIMAPDLGFGEEISIVLKAVSFGAKLTSNDTTRELDGESLYSIINRLVDEDIKGTVVWDSQAEARARSIIVNDNQNDNTYAYITNLLKQYNFKFFESGGTAKVPFQQFNVTDLSSISNQSAQFEIVMYGQINVPGRVYPAESFSANINHTLVSGAFHGAKTTTLATKDKLSRVDEAGTETYARVNKTQGKTVQGNRKEGRPVTSGGNNDGPASLRDTSAAGKRYMVVRKNSEDERELEAVKSETHDVMDGAYIVNVTCPLIPEAVPNKMVRFNVFTGDDNAPKFTTVSGLYKIHEVKHSVSDSGGTTELVLKRSIGDTPSEKEGVGKSNDVVVSNVTEAQANPASLLGNVISRTS